MLKYLKTMNDDKIWSLLRSSDPVNHELGLMLAKSQYGLSKNDLIEYDIDNLNFYSSGTSGNLFYFLDYTCFVGIEYQIVSNFPWTAIPYNFTNKPLFFNKQGVYDCNMYEDNNLTKCKLYYWNCEKDYHVGFIVPSNNMDLINIARKAFRLKLTTRKTRRLLQKYQSEQNEK